MPGFLARYALFGSFVAAVASLAVPTAHAADVALDRITWGNEIADRSQVGHFAHRRLTPDPDKVEVLLFFPYTEEWMRIDPAAGAWAASLADAVTVERFPVPSERSSVASSVYFVGKVLGIEDAVHDAIVRRIESRGVASLDEDTEADRLLTALGVEPGAFAKMSGNPFTETRADTYARWARNRHRAAVESVRKREGALRDTIPVITVNGKFAVMEGNPGRTVRVANRLIRRELGSLPSHDGPTNNEELAEWMAPRSGEIFRVAGTKWTGVYSHARREIWQLDNRGDISRSAPLRGEGDDSYFVFRTSLRWDGKTYHDYELWRSAHRLRSFEGRGGPQRHGAFLFADWLAAPDRGGVTLRFKGTKKTFRFSADGSVVLMDGSGSEPGTWWLQAGRLYVSLGELGTDYWPWEVASRTLGFDAPYKALTPWK